MTSAIDQSSTEPRTEWPSHSGIRASAGSGKTYKLTGHYLRTFLQGTDASGMLATTFTKKAAGEIQERVLGRLSRACISDEELSALAKELDLAGLTSAQARAALVRLCASLHQVAISTIDGFFNRLMNVYRHELGLPSGVRLSDENAIEMLRLREAAITDVLAATGDRDRLLRLLDDLHETGPGRSIAIDLQRRLTEAYQVYVEAPVSAWTLDVEPGTLLSDNERLTAIAAIERAAAKSTGIANALTSNAASARKSDWKEFLSRGIAKPIAAGEQLFNRNPIADDVRNLYRPLMEHARAELLRVHFGRTKALYDMLALYDRAYVRRRNSAGVLLFGDVPAALALVLPKLDPAASSYRLGRPVTHLLLDEFQDTSPTQYAILKPFAESIQRLNDDRAGSIFCVGDRKQSIYGWRGGTPELFDQIKIDLPCLEWTDNNISYRSSQIVLDAVNKQFQSLATNLILADAHSITASQWQDRYGIHTAHFKLDGYVELVQPPPDVPDAESSDGDEETDSDALVFDPYLDYCARKIKEIVDTRPNASIGVLTRNVPTVKRMIFQLTRLGVPASAEGGSPISDDPAVSVVLSAIQFADHPADTSAQFHVANSPLGAVVHLVGSDFLDPFLAADRIRRVLVTDGYAATISRWTSELAGSCDERGMSRLTQLIELADAYDRRPGARPIEFVQHIRNQSVETPSEYKVRVMTIHKAKGLEFDVVVLPELHKRILHPNPVVFTRDKATLGINAVTLRPSQTLRSLEPRLAAITDQHTAQQVSESLCLLYVAMTRARHALHIIVPHLKVNKSGSARKAELTLAAIVRAGLPDVDANTDTALPEMIWSLGDRNWRAKPPAEGTSNKAEPVERRQDRPPVQIALEDLPPRTRRRVTPSGLESGSAKTVDDLLRIAGESARTFGTMLHVLFECVEAAGTPLPASSNIERIARSAHPAASSEDCAACVREFRALLLRPGNASALSLPPARDGERAEVWRERSFSAILPDNSYASGRFDRVTVVHDTATGKAVRAALVDFKTDNVSDPARRQAAIDAYRPQMALYRSVLQQILGLTPDQVTATILFVSTGESIADA